LIWDNDNEIPFLWWTVAEMMVAWDLVDSDIEPERGIRKLVTNIYTVIECYIQTSDRMFIKRDRKQLMKLGMLADTEILTTHQLLAHQARGWESKVG